MNSDNFLPWSSAATRRRCILPGLAFAILAIAACTPPSADDSNAGEPVEPATDAVPEESTPQVSQLDALLDRLGEPPLADNCAPDITTYRISRLEWERGAAAVRVFSGPGDDDRGYRSVFSAALGQAISSDGWVSERMWDRIETEFDFSDFKPVPDGRVRRTERPYTPQGLRKPLLSRNDLGGNEHIPSHGPAPHGTAQAAPDVAGINRLSDNQIGRVDP